MSYFHVFMDKVSALLVINLNSIAISLWQKKKKVINQLFHDLEFCQLKFLSQSNIQCFSSPYFLYAASEKF